MLDQASDYLLDFSNDFSVAFKLVGGLMKHGFGKTVSQDFRHYVQHRAMRLRFYMFVSESPPGSSRLLSAEARSSVFPASRT